MTDRDIRHQEDNMSKNISEIFDIEPIQREKPKPVVVVDMADNDIDQDAALARANIKHLINVGMNAVVDLEMIAKDAESLKSYETLSNVLSTLTTMNSQLLDVHAKRKKVKKVDVAPQGGPDVPGLPNSSGNTIIFAGTTAEVNKLIMERLKK